MTSLNDDEQSHSVPSSEAPSWEWLARTIGEKLGKSRRHSGTEGFEGLIARLLEALTGERFFVARAGSQPAGDAANQGLHVAVQAKLYGKARLDTTEIRGDITRVAEIPGLEVYILVATKPQDLEIERQLRPTAEFFGIDFLFLSLSNTDPSPIGALAVKFWAEVTAGFLGISAEGTKWAAEQCKNSDIQDLIENIRREIRQSVASREIMSGQSAKLLATRLFPSARPLMGTAVNEAEYVPRKSLIDEMNRWWKHCEEPLVLLGEEGMGKSWATAGWLISQSLECPVVWFDSNQWHSCRGVSGLVDLSSRNLAGISAPEAKIGRMKQKLWKRWPSPSCLVVLDGANENDATEAMMSILTEYFSGDEIGIEARKRFRLLITSRPLPLVSSRIPKACQELHVGPFDDLELQQALDLATSGKVRIGDLPSRSLEVVRRPRYLRLFLDLLPSFSALEDITVEAVLFKRLLQILDEKRSELVLEPQEGVNVLGRLIGITKPRGTERILQEHSRLRELLPDAKNALFQLQDAGWFQDVQGGRKSITKTHVQLAWALFFLYEASREEELPLIQQIERLRSVQEPGLDDGLRSNALGAALDLSTSQLKDSGTQAKACLFTTWLLSHNSRLQGPRFDQVLADDPLAYFGGIEALWQMTRHTSWEKFIVRPLIQEWTTSGLATTSIRDRLVKWLLHFRDAEVICGSDREAEARFRSWTDLQWIAVRVFGYRCDSELIRIFCEYLSSFSKLGKDHQHLRHRAARHVGFLLRWSYQERTLPLLREIASNSGSASEGLEAARDLAGELWQAELPAVLRENSQTVPRSEEKDESDQFRLGQKGLLSRLTPEEFCERAPLGIAELAGDPDVSDLGPKDRLALLAGLRTLIRTEKVRDYGHQSYEDVIFDAWIPWLARSTVSDWWEIITELIERQIDDPEPQRTLTLFPILGIWPAGRPIARRVEECLVLAIGPGGEKLRENVGLVDFLRWALHLEDTEALFRCLEALSADTDAEILKLHPIPWVMKWALDLPTFEAAGERRRAAAYDVDLRPWFVIEWSFVDRLPRQEALAWCSEVAPLAVHDEDLRWLLVDQLARIADPGALELLLGYEGIAQTQHPETQGKILDLAIRSGELDHLKDRYPEFVDGLSFENRGTYLLEAGSTEELRQWGHDLFSSISGEKPILVPTSDDFVFEWNRRALHRWAHLEPTAFVAAAQKVLDSADSFRIFDRRGRALLEAILIVWQEVEPLAAAEARAKLDSGLVVHHTWFHNKVPLHVDALWNPEFSARPEHRALRLQSLRSSPSDKDIAQHAVAARSNGMLAEVESIGEELLSLDRQLERVLGVSLLAWHPEGDRWLKPLLDSDPSMWVRQHAEWAIAVCRRDRLGRQIYREALSAPTWLAQQARFEMLIPLVLPTFPLWQNWDKEFQQLAGILPPRRMALLVDFTYYMGKRVQWKDVVGRDLEKFCRGEDVSGHLEVGEKGPPWLRKPG